MNKLLSILLIAQSLTATQYYDFQEERYYSYPLDESIDQDVYHEESCIVAVITRDLLNQGIFRSARWVIIKSHLINKSLPETFRLLADLEEQEV